jgi:hypothetical protein
MSKLNTIENTFTVELAGDSIWDYEGAKTVTVNSITVETFEDDANEFMHDYKSIYVGHDTTWEIYTDSGFERAISEALGYDVTFTEQGMQEDGFASMET